MADRQWNNGIRLRAEDCHFIHGQQAQGRSHPPLPSLTSLSIVPSFQMTLDVIQSLIDKVGIHKRVPGRCVCVCVCVCV